jgi:hypothetical protein
VEFGAFCKTSARSVRVRSPVACRNMGAAQGKAVSDESQQFTIRVR